MVGVLTVYNREKVVGTDLSHLYSDPEAFFSASYHEAKESFLELDDDWEDVEDDHQIDKENKLLMQVQEPVTSKAKSALEEGEVGELLKAGEQAIFMRSWKYFSSFWTVTIANFWTKIDILNNYKLDFDAFKLLRRLAGIGIKSTLKIGPRSDIRKRKHLHGRFLPFIYKAKIYRWTGRRYGEVHCQRVPVRPRPRQYKQKVRRPWSAKRSRHANR